jgi:dethiobiotin synthase
MPPQLIDASFIIAGTDTGVGKTFVACQLAQQFKKSGKSVGVFKPFESGGNSDSRALQKASNTKQTMDEICFYSLKLPASPYQAALSQKIKIDFTRVVKTIKQALPKNQINIIELAGGLLVPITSTHTNLDLIKALKLPVILVAANKLGTINHSLMTLQILKQNKIKVERFYLNNFLKNQNKKVLRSNLEQIKMFFPGIEYLKI